MKIRVRLTLQFLAIVSTILLIFSVGIYYFSASYRKYDFYNRLRDRAYTTAKLFISVKEVDENLLRIIDKNTNTLIKENIIIFNNRKELLYSSTDIIPVKVQDKILDKIKARKEYHFIVNDRECIGIEYFMKESQYFVVASAYDLFGFNKLRNLSIILLVGFFISVLVIFIAGHVYAGRALSPITSIIEKVKSITITNLNMRLNEGNGKDELAMLASTFNTMLSGLEKSFVLQRDFIANASHELRTPITIIVAEIDYLLMQERKVDVYQRSLITISDDLKKFNETMTALFFLSLASIEQRSVEKSLFRVDELLLDVRLDFLKLHHGCNVVMDFNDLPDDVEALVVEGYETLLSIAFRNIIDNGCKFSADKTVVIKPYLTENLCVSFKDNGIGIPDEDRESVFQPFKRGNNARNVSGQGLGLPLIKKVIEIHRGSLVVKSEKNRGTEFIVSFPCAIV